MEPILHSEEQTAVGITEYITQGDQIFAISKYLLTDFIVNQIDMNGNLVTLKKRPQKIDAPPKETVNYDMSEELLTETRQLLGDQAAKEIEALYQQLETGQKIQKWEFKFEAPKDKEGRTVIHNFIREKLHGLDSNTTDGSIRMTYQKNLKKKNPLSRKKYIHFTLYKSNIDTAGALFRLSKATAIGQRLFSTAGLKDKRGVTTQRVSLYNYELSKLTNFYQHWERNRQIWIDDFLEHQIDKIGVGDLKGNQFALILRCVKEVEFKEIEKRVNSLKTVGMVNYFGMQRFGTYKTKTHEIGLQLIRKNWQKVVEDLILQETRDDNVNSLKEELYHYKNYSQAERSLPNKFKIEKLLFRGLVRHGPNYANVFESLPRSMKTIYVHALQSYIWNKITSRRMREHGLELVEGDLVGSSVGKMKKPKGNAEKEEEDGNEPNTQREEDEDEQRGEEDDEEEFKLDIITPQNIGKYTINDLVAPLYGPTSQVPENAFLHRYIDDELKQLNLTHKDFLDNSKMLCFKGNFRRMIIKPESVEFKLIKHSEKREQLQTGLYTLGDEIETKEGKYTSIKLILRLPKSSYATMAMREILHIPSSLKCQKTLNEMYEKEE